MKLSGFSDEAGKDLATQISATKELGWSYLSARAVDGVNIHDLPEKNFQQCVELLQAEGIKVAEFGSLIGSWSKSIGSDFDITLGEVERCIQRMPQLDVNIVRIMSYAQCPWGEEQFEQERFRRLREITQRFTDAGITVAHENCMNWGGFSSDHTQRLIEEIPNLKLIFDTGNPVFQLDRSKPNNDGSFPWQDALDFYQQVKEHIVHIHIKDCVNPVSANVEPEYTFPGDGQAYVKEILTELKNDNYDGFIAIEPHVGTVFHTAEQEVDWQQCYSSYLKYGKQLESLTSR